ncbi:phage holin family protein [Streptomyces sp. NBC_01795]|uniref:phage holin family protein n=1 Tax=unclassified Streptomyces TaxID=2593676 RepID=UPI002DDAB5AC|nr:MULTISPECIES: phage holin family protein [unclassified Streptomyces]WSA91168.1 phage holin family protein [Streptomyces sp. NBC_01795]WSS16224.1 phage holin family protein [Streptomyces sp. NBC_01186]
MSDKAIYPGADTSHGAAPAGDLSEPMAHLVREQLKAVEEEMRAEVRARVSTRTVKLNAGAGAATLYGGGALVAAVGLALALVLPGWAAFLIVAGALFALAAALRNAARGRGPDRVAPPTPSSAPSAPARARTAADAARAATAGATAAAGARAGAGTAAAPARPAPPTPEAAPQAPSAPPVPEAAPPVPEATPRAPSVPAAPPVPEEAPAVPPVPEEAPAKSAPSAPPTGPDPQGPEPQTPRHPA